MLKRTKFKADRQFLLQCIKFGPLKLLHDLDDVSLKQDKGFYVGCSKY